MFVEHLLVSFSMEIYSKAVYIRILQCECKYGGLNSQLSIYCKGAFNITLAGFVSDLSLLCGMLVALDYTHSYIYFFCCIMYSCH